MQGTVCSRSREPMVWKHILRSRYSSNIFTAGSSLGLPYPINELGCDSDVARMKRMCNNKRSVESSGVVHEMTGPKVPHISFLGKEQTKSEHMHLLMLHQFRGS
jgi:hypothetical protein